MKKHLFLILTLSVSMLGQKVKPSKRIEADCILTDGQKCYNIYESQHAKWFGVYSMDAEFKPVTLIEKLDCEHPNGTMQLVAGGPSVPVFKSSQVKNLYAVCPSR